MTDQLRAATLVRELQSASNAFVALVRSIPPELWLRVASPGVWSPSKDAEHVADAAIYHQWIVRSTLRQKVSSKRPAIERTRLRAQRSQREVVALIKERTAQSIELIKALTPEELALASRPPRDPPRTLADIIERVMIGHYRRHGADIDAKLNA